MVGLLLVGHSADVVRGVLAMVAQAAPAVPTGGAGGLAGGRLGTNAVDATEALRATLEASGGDGVVALLDLGSAAMALEIALEALEPGERERVMATDAPFVEGAVLAAVASAGGASLAGVRAAAESARAMAKLPRA